MSAPSIAMGPADDLAKALARAEYEVASRDDVTAAGNGALDENVGLAHATASNERHLSLEANFHDQPYLTGAGINLPAMRGDADAARWARYDGAGVQFIQIEEGWDVRHNAFNQRVRKESAGTDFSIGQVMHGNAGLGIVLANGPASRIRGIAPGCTLKGLYALKYAAGRSHERLEKAIGLAARNLVAGDVILLALQVNDTLLPVETDPGVFKAIRAATAKGIIVIEAAGNQGRPLEDALEHPTLAEAWADPERDVPVFQGLPDSGAIMVSGCTVSFNGAGYNEPRQDKYTRRGPRVDCCAWSRNVWTSYGEPSDYNYFNGTSASASAIAGLALIVQQHAKVRLRRPLTPVEMRGLFHDPTCGTGVRPTDPSDSITMPDAMKLFKRLDEISS